MENLIFKGTYTEDEIIELDLEMHCELEGEVFEHEYPYNSYLTTRQFYNEEGDQIVYIYNKYWNEDIQVYDVYFKEEENLKMLEELKKEFKDIDNLFINEIDFEGAKKVLKQEKEIENDIDDLTDCLDQRNLIVYKESKTLNSEIDFAKLIDEKAENAKSKLFEQSNCLNIDEIELNKILSKACEIKKIIIYSKYNDEIMTDEILYKRNQNNTISIFEKMEQ